MSTEDLVRWTFGDDLPEKDVTKLVAKLHKPPRAMSDLDLVLERRVRELGQRLKN